MACQTQISNISYYSSFLSVLRQVGGYLKIFHLLNRAFSFLPFCSPCFRLSYHLPLSIYTWHVTLFEWIESIEWISSLVSRNVAIEGPSRVKTNFLFSSRSGTRKTSHAYAATHAPRLSLFSPSVVPASEAEHPYYDGIGHLRSHNGRLILCLDPAPFLSFIPL